MARHCLRWSAPASIQECNGSLRGGDQGSGCEKPEPDAAAYYDRAYQIYRSLYPALKQTYRAIGTLDA